MSTLDNDILDACPKPTTVNSAMDNQKWVDQAKPRRLTPINSPPINSSSARLRFPKEATYKEPSKEPIPEREINSRDRLARHLVRLWQILGAA